MPEPKRLHLTTIRLEAEQVAAVAVIAKRESRSFGGALRVLVSEAIAARSRKSKKAA